MTSRTGRALLAGVLAAGAVACSGAPSADESPNAVPGMDGQTQPSIGTGVTEAPDIGGGATE